MSKRKATNKQRLSLDLELRTGLTEAKYNGEVFKIINLTDKAKNKRTIIHTRDSLYESIKLFKKLKGLAIIYKEVKYTDGSYQKELVMPQSISLEQAAKYEIYK